MLRDALLVAGGGAFETIRKESAIALMIPLALFGLAVAIYYLFVSASLALPLAAGFGAGLAALEAGATFTVAGLTGLAVFLALIALGRIAIVLANSAPSRHMVLIAFAVPAALAGYSLGALLGTVAGFGGMTFPFAMAGAVACAAGITRRLTRPA